MTEMTDPQDPREMTVVTEMTAETDPALTRTAIMQVRADSVLRETTEDRAAFPFLLLILR
jgi:hypothetical protein